MATPTETVSSDDLLLLQQLATLQTMHSQVHSLRTLLPNRLLEPFRAAISTPQSSSPQILSTQLTKAARGGVEEIGAFKKNWQDEKIKELMREANRSEIGQGTDAWLIDYKDMVKHHTQADGNNTVMGTGQNGRFDSFQESLLAINAFNDKKYSHSTLKPAGEGEELPFILTTAEISFMIDRNGQDQCYTITLSPSNENSKLATKILNAIQQAGPWRKLEGLLDMLVSYHDVRRRSCEKCKSLVDKDFELPILRRLVKRDDKEGWLAYHPECV